MREERETTRTKMHHKQEINNTSKNAMDPLREREKRRETAKPKETIQPIHTTTAGESERELKNIPCAPRCTKSNRATQEK